MLKLVPYNHKWPEIFNNEAESLKSLLGDNLLEVHHIGSTSIANIYSKDKIDILIVVKDLKKIPAFGYQYRGEFNIPFHSCYIKREGELDINLHAFEEGNSEIKLNLLFRDFLRNNTSYRQEYEALKLKLVNEEINHQKNNSIFTGYNLGKNEFIQKILNLAGFDELCLKYCTHYSEWERYHRIRIEEIFTRMKVEYDYNHSSLKDPNHRHFVLYKGAQIIGVACIEFLSLSDVALRPFAIDKDYQNQGFGSKFLSMIEKWVKWNGRNTIRLNAEPKAISFYQRLGYDFMEFMDYPRGVRHNYQTIAMGKIF